MTKPAPKKQAGKLLPIEIVLLASLKPHPKNYRGHPQDQVEEIAASISSNGVYKNIVVSKDSFVLAGEGVYRAALHLKLKQLPIVRLPFAGDSVQALKVIAADNELSLMAEDDERLLSEILKLIKDQADDGLKGTGYDDAKLIALLMNTRPQSEIESHDAAAEWAGIEDYLESTPIFKLLLTCESIESRAKLIELLHITNMAGGEKLKSAVWPPEDRQDIKSIKIMPKGEVTSGS